MKAFIAKVKARLAARRPRLIEEWRHGWKFLSVQLTVVAGFAQSVADAAVSVPPWVHDYIPQAWWGYLARAAFFSAILLRFVKQRNVPHGGGHE